MLSGIGPKEHLKSKKIPVVMDLPGVGENLHNHQSYGLTFTLDETYYPVFNESNIEQYIRDQTGPLSSTGLAQVSGILTSNFTTPDDPDIQVFFSGYQAMCEPINGIHLAAIENKMAVEFTAVNLQPTSRGELSLPRYRKILHFLRSIHAHRSNFVCRSHYVEQQRSTRSTCYLE